jgi:hypothetical protein
LTGFDKTGRFQNGVRYFALWFVLREWPCSHETWPQGLEPSSTVRDPYFKELLGFYASGGKSLGSGNQKMRIFEFFI